jgi:hypothetical protein
VLFESSYIYKVRPITIEGKQRARSRRMETRREATKAAAAKSARHARHARRRAHSIVAPMRQRRHPLHYGSHRLLEEGAIVNHQLLENVGLHRRDAL